MLLRLEQNMTIIKYNLPSYLCVVSPWGKTSDTVAFVWFLTRTWAEYQGSGKFSPQKEFWWHFAPRELEFCYAADVIANFDPSFSRNMVTQVPCHLRWLKTVSSTFQDIEFDGSLLPLFTSWCYNHGIKKLPNNWWTRWYYFRDTIGYHSNTMGC